MIVFGHQPSASTQQMVAAGPTCRAIKDLNPQQPIILVGGHVAALPERTLREEQVDFACNSEGPITVQELLDALRARGRRTTFPRCRDWSGATTTRSAAMSRRR